MKKIILLILLGFIVPKVAVCGQGVDFFGGTYAEDLAAAKTEGKMVFIDCYTQWCGPCKMMAAQVFPRAEVGDYVNPRFVFMKLDMENGEGPDLNKNFKVRAYPTYLIFDGDGNEVSRFDGYMAPDSFIAKIKSIIDKDKTPEAMKARYDAGERENTLMHEYIAVVSSQRNMDEALRLTQELMNGLTDEEKLEPEYWKYWTNYGYYNTAENFDFLIENRNKFKVGNREVSDFLVSVASNRYREIAFDYNAFQGRTASPEVTAQKLNEADTLAKKLELQQNAVIKLYRAAAVAKIDGNADILANEFETCANTIFNESERDNFLQNIFFFFGNDLTPEQRVRFAEMTNDERVKSMFQSSGGVRIIRNGQETE